MKDAMSNSEHGYDFQEAVYRNLSELRKDGYLSHVVKNFRIGEEGYLNKEQYYSPFLIQFNDRTRWILFTTTSLRTDRVKGQQWDSDRIKNRDETITRAFLVYPNDISPKELNAFASQRDKYKMKFEYSRIDDIISERMLLAQIKEKDDEILIESAGKKKRGKSRGRELDFNGRNFEAAVAAILSSPIYLADFKRNKASRSDMYHFYCTMMNGLDIPTNEVDSISATADRDEIGLLPSGGSPKTDVIVTLKMKNGKVEHRTITCKRSSQTSVSVHQYSADANADVIDRGNEKLRYLLRRFQEAGCMRDMDEAERKELEKELGGHVMRFSQWVIGGHGGDGTVLQKADYLIAYNSNKNLLAVHHIDEYIKKLVASGKGNFGTPFFWTRASKSEKKNFQLKIPMLFDEDDAIQ